MLFYYHDTHKSFRYIGRYCILRWALLGGHDSGGPMLHDSRPKAHKRKSLPAATKLGQGNIFTSVCQEFCPRGGGCLPQCMLGYQSQPPQSRHSPGTRHPPLQGADTPPWSRHPLGADTPPGADTPWNQAPPREADCSIRSTSGRYASYWNAFLLGNKLQLR